MASELKLEVGKYYKTRDGRKVGPAWRGAGTDSYPWKLPSFYGDHWHADDGKSCVESDRDLIAEWPTEPTGPVRTDADATPMLTADNKRLRDAGNALAIAAINVATEYDGVHRLMLAVADWAKAVADEGGRGDRA